MDSCWATSRADFEDLCGPLFIRLCRCSLFCTLNTFLYLKKDRAKQKEKCLPSSFKIPHSRIGARIWARRIEQDIHRTSRACQDVHLYQNVIWPISLHYSSTLCIANILTYNKINQSKFLLFLKSSTAVFLLQVLDFSHLSVFISAFPSSTAVFAYELKHNSLHSFVSWHLPLLFFHGLDTPSCNSHPLTLLTFQTTSNSLFKLNKRASFWRVCQCFQKVLNVCPGSSLEQLNQGVSHGSVN